MLYSLFQHPPKLALRVIDQYTYITLRCMRLDFMIGCLDLPKRVLSGSMGYPPISARLQFPEQATSGAYRIRSKLIADVSSSPSTVGKTEYCWTEYIKKTLVQHRRLIETIIAIMADIKPPFTAETARKKVKAAQDLWNTQYVRLYNKNPRRNTNVIQRP